MKKPILNAVFAATYIVAVSSLMFYGSGLAPKTPTVIAPIAMLSLLTFSVAVMGYLFAGQPIQMYMDGNKSGAVKFFLQTLASFAGVTLLVLVVVATIFG